MKLKLSSKTVLAAFVAVAVSACAKKDDDKKTPAAAPIAPPAAPAPGTPEKGGPAVPSVDENGACSPQFLQAWKATESALSNTNRSGGMENADKACDAFYANHANVVCKVKATVTDEEKFLESKNFKESCAEIKRVLGKPVEPVNPGATPAPEDDALEFSTVPANKIAFKILSVDKVKASMANTKIYFVNGRIGPIEAFNAEIEAGASYCMLIDTKRLFADKVGAGVVFPVLGTKDEIHRNGNRMLVLNMGEFFGLGCSKLNTRSYKLGEVRAALRGIADLAVLK